MLCVSVNKKKTRFSDLNRPVYYTLIFLFLGIVQQISSSQRYGWMRLETAFIHCKFDKYSLLFDKYTSQTCVENAEPNRNENPVSIMRDLRSYKMN